MITNKFYRKLIQRIKLQSKIVVDSIEEEMEDDEDEFMELQTLKREISDPKNIPANTKASDEQRKIYLNSKFVCLIITPNLSKMHYLLIRRR